MKTKWSKKIIVAAIMTASLFIGSGAEAAGLFALSGDSASAEREIGLFSEAIQWLNGAWNDLTSVFSTSEQGSPAPTANGCPAADPNCDQGPGIDPMG